MDKIEHERHRYVNALIGKPWVANAKGPDAFDCYSLVRKVQQDLFGREMPDVEIPNEPTWSLLIAQIEGHPERAHWTPTHISTHALDGSIVLMAASKHPAHIGVWLYPEHGVLHCNRPSGVTFDALLDLRTQGWHRLSFYEPRVFACA